MTVFSSSYKNQRLCEITMAEMDVLITSEANKIEISKAIYDRFFERYIKIFFYKSNNIVEYYKTENKIEKAKKNSIFNAEYKSGFSIMTNCSLLIETIIAFLQGDNQTSTYGDEAFNRFFIKAKFYNNPLSVFENQKFYKNIRCGLLHQGETYGGLKIHREGKLYNQSKKIINAKLFCDEMNNFLISYQKELITSDWDSEIWDNCRTKIRHIIKNSK
ncbi:hypothetical protein [Flavobacterium sp.]|uniref:hypothetical protein n=1 Tax=Flavobacterium sp. TaxID=239 RepID=UPI004047B22B